MIYILIYISMAVLLLGVMYQEVEARARTIETLDDKIAFVIGVVIGALLWPVQMLLIAGILIRKWMNNLE